MELDGETLDGHWAKDNNLGIDFFIINDATFSKLCILGDDVEPCYEGSSITSPQVSSNFTKENFEHTLFTMMEELKQIINNKGGLNMEKTNEQENIELAEDENLEVEQEVDFKKDQKEDNAKSEDNKDAKSEDKDKDESEDVDKEDDSKEEEKKEKKNFEVEEETTENNSDSSFALGQLKELNAELEALRAEVQELRNFKLEVESQKKRAMIDKYFMLSDEDKKDVIDNMANYSLDEIEAKLALIYVEQNVDFTVVDGQSNDKPSPAMTFSLDEEVELEQLTDLQRALRETRN